MELEDGLIAYAHVLGRCEAAWRFADTEVREAVGLSLVSQAWDAYRRDAGKGDVGPAHEVEFGCDTLLGANDDPRRNAFLLSLTDRAAAPLARSTVCLTRATGARNHFDNGASQLIQVAIDALAQQGGSSGQVTRAIARRVRRGPALESLLAVADAVDRLRADPAFTEACGSHVQHEFPPGSFSHYVPADPGAAWALNIALLLKDSPLARVPTPGFCCRAVFRLDLDADEIAASLVEQAVTALRGVESLFEQTFISLARGRQSLAYLSRNSRAREAWKLVSALGSISRPQLMRALELSRAGADIQAHVLAEAGLVNLGQNGRIILAAPRARGSHAGSDSYGDVIAAAVDLDNSMAEIDRLLARRGQPAVDERLGQRRERQ